MKLPNLAPVSVVASIACLLMIFTLGQSAQAQSTQKKNVEAIQVKAKDGWPLTLQYYKREGNREAPVVVLLHGKGQDARYWQQRGKTKGLADLLWEEKMAVICVDMRKHGESKEGPNGQKFDETTLKNNDYKAMVLFDLPAVKQFIFEEHQAGNLNMNKTVLVGTEMSCNVALAFAEIDWKIAPHDDAPTPALRTPRGQDVRALVLISPESRVSGIPGNPIAYLGKPLLGINFLFAASKNDSKDRGTTKRMFTSVKGRIKEDPRLIFHEEYPGKLRGMAMLGRGTKLESYIVAFVSKSMENVESKWVDRRSKLNR